MLYAYNLYFAFLGRFLERRTGPELAERPPGGDRGLVLRPRSHQLEETVTELATLVHCHSEHASEGPQSM